MATPNETPHLIADSLSGHSLETINATLQKVAQLLDETTSSRDASALVRRITDLVAIRDTLDPSRDGTYLGDTPGIDPSTIRIAGAGDTA